MRTSTCPDLPKEVVSIDIESHHGRFDRPEESGILFVGARHYTLKGTRYVKGSHRVYYEDQLEDLRKVLLATDGPVIGQNLLKFDYRILRPHISLRGIIEKTFDLLAFVFEKCNWPSGGMSLESLAQHNLGRGKTLQARRVADMWKRGKRKEVFEYNRNDCDLVFELWQKLVKNGSIQLTRFQQVAVETCDLPMLRGEMSYFTFTGWQKDIASKKHCDILIGLIRGTAGKRPVRLRANCDAFYCSGCGNYHVFEVRRAINRKNREWRCLAPRPRCQKLTLGQPAYKKPLFFGIAGSTSDRHKLHGKFVDQVSLNINWLFCDFENPLERLGLAYGVLRSADIDSRAYSLKVDWLTLAKDLAEQGEDALASKAKRIARHAGPRSSKSYRG